MPPRTAFSALILAGIPGEASFFIAPPSAIRVCFPPRCPRPWTLGWPYAACPKFWSCGIGLGDPQHSHPTSVTRSVVAHLRDRTQSDFSPFEKFLLRSTWNLLSEGGPEPLLLSRPTGTRPEISQHEVAESGHARPYVADPRSQNHWRPARECRKVFLVGLGWVGWWAPKSHCYLHAFRMCLTSGRRPVGSLRPF